MENQTPNTQPTSAPQAPFKDASAAFAQKSPFGQQQQQRKRRSSESEYKKSLTEKQTLKQWYGVSEKQFKKYVLKTLEKMGKVDDVSAELIKSLERRLDNVVFRMGLAKSRAQARQFVSHGFFSINGKNVNIPSYQVVTNDVIALKENKKKKIIFKELPEEIKKREIASWLKLDKTALQATAVGEPTLDEVKPPAEISLIFEFYSR